MKYFLALGSLLFLIGCTPSRSYQNPTEVSYEIEGLAEVTDQKAAEEAIQVIEKNIQYAKEEDMEGYLSTILSSAHENTRTELEDFFEEYDIEHTILSIEVIDQKADQMLVRVEQQSVAVHIKEGAEEYRDHVAEANHTLVLEEGEWKIAETTMTDTHFIE